MSAAMAAGLSSGSALAKAGPRAAFAMPVKVAQAPPATTTTDPATSLGASGPPVLQTAAPDSAAARQSAQNGTNVTTNPRAASNADSVVGEVLVTAERREQRLQQVPVAITAFTSEKRDLIGIQSIVDQTNFTPGLTYTQSNDRLSLRGVGRLTNAHTADSGTAIYVDGVFTTSTTEAGRSPLFVERTEILRGPQGTLYGRNAIGGAFNVISRRPTRDFSGEARLNVGNFDRARFDAAVSIPITDWLRTKVGFSKNYQGEGFSHNVIEGLYSENGRRDETYYEFQAAGEIGKFDFWLYFGKNIWDNSAPPGGVTGGSLAPSNTTGGTGTFPSASFCFGGALNCSFLGSAGNPVLVTGDLRARSVDTPFQNTLHDNEIVRTHLTYHFPNFDVKYVGGFQRYDYRFTDDTDGTAVQSYQVPLNPTAAAIPGTGGFNCAQLSAVGRCSRATVFYGNQNTYQEDEELYSHEVTVASTWDSPLQYIAGAYYYREKFAYPQNVYAPNQPQIATPILPNGTAAVANPLRRYAHTDNFANVVSKAVFGQVDYKLFSTFKLTGGIRYTQDDKKTTEEARFIAYGGSGAPTLDRYGILAPAVDITSFTIGTATAAQLAAQGGRQQGVIGVPIFDPITGYYKRNLRDGSNALTGTAGVEWAPDRRTLVYAKYSRGYKAFGFNTAVASAFSPFPYSKPEAMDAGELGLKKDWTRRLQTNITGFYDLYYDAQVPLTVQQGATPAFSIFYNVPRSIIQGIEVETVWQPVDKLNILFTYAYLDAHVSKACCVSDPNDPTAVAPGANPVAGSSQGAVDAITGQPARGQNLAGNDLPLSPHHKVALNVNYSYPIGKWGDLIGSVSYLWRGEQYSSFFNRPYNFTPSRDQVDLRLTFRDAKSRYRIIAYGRNVFDNDAFETLSGTRTTTGVVYQTYALPDPRTFGLELQASF